MTGVFLSLQLCLPQFRQCLLACRRPPRTQIFPKHIPRPFFHRRTISGASGWVLTLGCFASHSLAFSPASCPCCKMQGGQRRPCPQSGAGARACNRAARFYPFHLNCRTRSSSHVTGARPDRRNHSDCSLWLGGLLTFSPSSAT